MTTPFAPVHEGSVPNSTSQASYELQIYAMYVSYRNIVLADDLLDAGKEILAAKLNPGTPREGHERYVADTYLSFDLARFYHLRRLNEPRRPFSWSDL